MTPVLFLYQEGILLLYVHPDTYASIKNLENSRAEVMFDSIKRRLLKCDIDADFCHCTEFAGKMVNQSYLSILTLNLTFYLDK